MPKNVLTFIAATIFTARFLLIDASFGMEPITCGGTVELQGKKITLASDLDCPTEDPALIVVGPGKFDMGGHTITCGAGGKGLIVEGVGGEIRSGVVRGPDCDYCVVIAGEGHHVVKGMVARDCREAGFDISSEANVLQDNVFTNRQGFFTAREGFFSDGSDNTFIGNTASSAEVGFHLLGGSEITFKRNIATNNGEALMFARTQITAAF